MATRLLRTGTLLARSTASGSLGALRAVISSNRSISTKNLVTGASGPSVIGQRTMASTASTNPDPKEAKSIFEFAAEDINGKPFSFQTLEGKVVMIVNTAGQCGLAQRNFTEMVELHDKYRDQGFEIVAFPSNSFNQEKNDGDAIVDHAKGYGVKFPIMSKIAVNGSDTHPLYTYLKGASPGWLTNSLKWNFTKFLCDRTGVPRKRFGPQEAPSTMATDIESLLAEKPGAKL